ncbi:MAG TPA: hypothetical protein VFQ25_12790 [Ktedonobacterales bacterium]|nr:hypothetical protein [Ktedonobacterales bacterium]
MRFSLLLFFALPAALFLSLDTGELPYAAVMYPGFDGFMSEEEPGG